VAIINVKEILENFKEEDNSLKHSSTNPLIENEEKIISKLFREKLSKEKKEILKVIKEANKEFIEIEIDKMEEVDVLSPGDSFGELALISERPRAASVIAKGHLSLLVLKKTQFKAILGAISEKKVSLKVKQLKNFPYFASWSKNALSRLTFYFRLSQISHNQALFTQGERVNGIFFIVEGEFILTKKVESRDSQPYVFQSDLDQQNVKKIKSIKITKEKKIIIKGKNESIGGYEIFNNLSFRQFSCSCNSTTAEVFFISKEQFLSKVPNIESIRSIIHTENMRLEERFQKICEFDKSSLANKIFQSHSGKKNVYFNPKLDSSFLRHSRKIDESWTSGKSLTIRTESSLKRSSFKDAFRKLTQTEISEAVNGRSLTVKKKSKALKTFIQKRAPPKSFLREFRKKLLKPSDS
jgi:CRP-like cAMP-binding protein